MKIIIGFSKPTTFKLGSWLIRWYQGTKYSHTYVKFKGKTRDFIYESVGKSGTRFVGTKCWNSHAKVVKEFNVYVDDIHYYKLMDYCIDHEGVEYGFIQNIGIFIADLFKLKKNPFKTGYNCSEIVADILKSQGYQIDKDSNLITPRDIYGILESSAKNNN